MRFLNKLNENLFFKKFYKALKMGSRKDMLIKKRLCKAFKSNRNCPNWKRQLQENRYKDIRNRARRNWRSSVLKIY